VGFEVGLEGGGEVEPGQVIELGVAVTNTSGRDECHGAPGVALEARLVPVTSHGRRRASHTVVVRNLGNLSVPVSVEATDGSYDNAYLSVA
jgi:hypothetical protein